MRTKTMTMRTKTAKKTMPRREMILSTLRLRTYPGIFPRTSDT
jgi:hypothetical protein